MSHSRMIGKVTAMEPGAFQTWLAGGKATGSMADIGAKVFTDLGCATCHLDGGQGRGPSLRGVFGSQVTLANGEKVTADEGYIRESILTPTAKLVAGFQPLMPTFQGVVSEEQIAQLTAYVKTLANAGRNRRARDGPRRRRRGRGARTGRHAAGRGPLENDYGSLDREADELPELHARRGVVVLDQDHKRIALLYLFSVSAFFLHGRHLRHPHPPGTADAGRRLRQQRDLQQVLHDARRDDGVLLPHPVDPGDAGQLPGADDDRGEGPGLPAHQPAQLVHLHRRRPVRRHRDGLGRRRHRLDLLRALQHGRLEHPRGDDRPRRLHRRVLLDPHRLQLHRHHPHDARARA